MPSTAVNEAEKMTSLDLKPKEEPIPVDDRPPMSQQLATKQVGSSEEKTSAGQATGQAAGTMIGSLFPGVGTVVGGAIGGLAGAAVDYTVNHMDVPAGPSRTLESGRVGSEVGGPDTMKEYSKQTAQLLHKMQSGIKQLKVVDGLGKKG